MATTASVHTTGAGLRQEVRIDAHHTAAIDEPACLGGSDSAPAPFDLLAAALAGCVSITVRMYADRKDIELADVGVDVELDRAEPPPRPRRTPPAPRTRRGARPRCSSPPASTRRWSRASSTSPRRAR